MPEKQPDGTFIETIDDVEYRFQLWGAKKAIEVGMLLAAIAAKPIEVLGDAIKNAEGTDEMDMAMLGGTIAAVFQGMGTHRKDAQEVIEALATFGVERRQDGGELRKVGNFDHAYRGKLGHLRKVVTAAAEVQYSDFFAEIGGALASARARKMKMRSMSSQHKTEG